MQISDEKKHMAQRFQGANGELVFDKHTLQGTTAELENDYQ
jgi:hypothetical protein